MTIYEKIAKIQDEVEVRKSADNPYFHSKYATYEGVLNAIHDSMRKHSLVAIHGFQPSSKDGYLRVITMIKDYSSEDGQHVDSDLEIPLLKNDPQSAGSAITYAKRYSLLAILGLGTEDDDGNSSSGKTVTSQPAVKESGLHFTCKCGKRSVIKTVTVNRGTDTEKQREIMTCPDATRENAPDHTKSMWMD